MSAFRSTLARESEAPVNFYEIPLELGRFGEPESEDLLVTFLGSRIRERPMDLVVPIGAAGAAFSARQRDRLFPHTPVLYAGASPRVVTPECLRTNATLVTQPVNLPAMAEDIL